MQDIPKEVIKEASQGDEKAFEQIYRTASGFVHNVALRLIGNIEDAEEVTQDVFVKIFNKLGTYRFESSLKTWIYRITVNSAINQLRKKKRIEDRQVPYDDAIGKVESEQHEQEEIVQPLLELLNPEQRACVVLRSIEGLSYQEIAESLKININTVRSRLKRAREKLISYKREVKVG